MQGEGSRQASRSGERRGVGHREFTLPDAQGRPVSSIELLKNGPVVITFYRGVWCPYCNFDLLIAQSKWKPYKASRRAPFCIYQDN
ncbi:redoxin domain-containing protein [Paraburkholderia sp.]|uniref:redoxin domain-containing protein n=1 Tax=Paraburkholderia sp. TaxID=1926495 RepID=UPI003C736573